jgi:hypothetical protein
MVWRECLKPPKTVLVHSVPTYLFTVGLRLEDRSGDAKEGDEKRASNFLGISRAPAPRAGGIRSTRTSTIIRTVDLCCLPEVSSSVSQGIRSA